jgi:Uma2 family endonuclease
MPMTLDEFDEASFRAGYRCELIHGVLVVTPPPSVKERDANEDLGYLLRTYQESHPQGRALDLTVPEHNVRTKTQNRRCDRAIWAGLGRLPQTEGPVRRRDLPTIVVEFSSSRPADMRRDFDEKRIEYRDAGIREYWIIDRFRRTMAVYSWRGKRWVKRVVSEGESYSTPLLPGFVLELNRMLRVWDKYKRGP